MEIDITFINQSDDVNNSEVVIFQKNVAATGEETAIAWQVIQNCGKGWSHQLRYPMDAYVAVMDSWGNFSNLQPAVNGQQWNVSLTPSGDTLSLDSNPAPSDREIVIKNCLPKGMITAQIYKDGKLLAEKTGLAPQQTAAFAFQPTLWVGVVSQAEEGQVMEPALISSLNTEFSLLGIAKADLVMTGGGAGTNASPFLFTLQNIQYA